MSSPDVSPYVGLAFFTRSRQDIFDAMLADAQVRWPEWNPLEAHTEVQLLEVFAAQQWELEQRLNTAPDRAFEGLLIGLGVSRDPGARPLVPLTVTVIDGPAQTLPAGTRLLWTPPDGSGDIQLSVLEAVAFNAGVTSMPVSAVGVSETSDLNGLTGGPARFIDSVPYVESIAVGQATGGRDPEDSAAYRSRGALRLSRLTSTLVEPEQFRAATLEDPDVARAFVLENYNPDAGSGAPGDHPGHTTVSARGAGGAALTSDKLAAVDAALTAEAYALLSVHVVNSTVTPVNVTATLVRSAGYSDSDVQANAVAALTAYLNPDTWPYSQTVYRNELIALLDGVPGVERVASLGTPSSDLALTGYGTLVTAGTFTIATTA